MERVVQAPEAATNGVNKALLHKFVIAIGKVAKIDYDAQAKAMMSPQQLAAFRLSLQERERQVKSDISRDSAVKGTLEIASRMQESEHKLKPTKIEEFLSAKQQAALRRWYRQKVKATVSGIMPYQQYRVLEKKLSANSDFRHRYDKARMALILGQEAALPWYQRVKNLRKTPPGCLRFSSKKIIPIRGTLIVGITYGPPYVTDQGTARSALFLKLNPPLDVCHIKSTKVAPVPRSTTAGALFGVRQQYQVTKVTYYNLRVPALFVLGDWLGHSYQFKRSEAVKELVSPYLAGHVQIWARLIGDTNNPGGWAVDNVLKVCLVRHNKLVRCRGSVRHYALVSGTIEPASAASSQLRL